MKTAFASTLSALALLAFVGCEGGGTTGGPGATNPSSPNAGATTDPAGPGAAGQTGNTSAVGQDDNTFSLNPPNLATSIKQGETKQVTIGINRGDGFTQDVSLKFDGVPPGVTMTPADGVIKASDKEVTFGVAAAADAAVGEHEIKITGHPATGADSTNTFKIKIDAP